MGVLGNKRKYNLNKKEFIIESGVEGNGNKMVCIVSWVEIESNCQMVCNYCSIVTSGIYF